MNGPFIERKLSINASRSFLYGPNVRHEKLEVDPSVAIHVDVAGIVGDRPSPHSAQKDVTETVEDESVSREHADNSELFVDNSEVPPLI